MVRNEFFILTSSMPDPIRPRDPIPSEWLKFPENAAAYLNAVLGEGDKSAMLIALREVAQANGGNC